MAVKSPPIIGGRAMLEEAEIRVLALCSTLSLASCFRDFWTDREHNGAKIIPSSHPSDSAGSE